MLREPWFWHDASLAGRAASTLMLPAALLYDAGRRARNAITKPAHTEKPIICIGNATLGGVGKTPFALMLQRLLDGDSISASFLLRGYGGALAGPTQVDPEIHTAADVGDEALLLARAGDTVVARDRAAGAKVAGVLGDVIIMDDGYQNPTIEKTISILIIDANDPQGNCLLFPAGPLREPMAQAVARADIVIFITANKNKAIDPAALNLAGGKPAARAWLTPSENMPSPSRVVAFSGIGRPAKFFDLLDGLGFDIAKRIPFADHQPFSPAALMALKKTAKDEGATLITTEKDIVRLGPVERENILTLPVEMEIDGAPELMALIINAIENERPAK